MRKVCPTCKGKGKLQIKLGESIIIKDVSCFDCDMTGYIDVPEGSDEKSEESADTDNL